MSHRTSRLAAALLAAAIASLGTAGAADAAKRMPTADQLAGQQLKRGTTILAVEAFPTGDGPADEEVCDNFADNIFSQLLNMKWALKHGDAEGAQDLADAVENLEDMAMDAGCVVIH